MAELTEEQLRILDQVKARSGGSLDEDLTKSYVGQAVAGANEGIYDTLGAPVDLVSSGINAVSGLISGEDVIQDPVGGSAWLKRNLSATIPPKTGETGKDLVRAGGRELGAGVLPAAGLYARGANLASRAVGGATSVVDDMARAAYRSPGALAAGEVGSAVGAVGGAGAGRAVGDFVGAPETGEAVGRLVGGVTGGVGGSALAGDRIMPRGPSTDDLRADAGRIYDGIRSSGVTMPGPAVTLTADRIEAMARNRGWISPDGIHVSPRLRGVMRHLRSYESGDMSLDHFQNLRREIIDDAIDKARKVGSDREIALLEDVRREMTTVGSAVWRDLPRADELYSRAMRHRELVDEPLALARSSGLTAYAQGGETLGRSRAYKKLHDDDIKGTLRGATAREREVIGEISEGTRPFRAARWMGKFAPTSAIPTMGTIVSGGAVGSMLGPVIGGGTTAAMMAGGTAGRAAASRLQNMKVNELSELIRTGRYGGARVLSDIDRTILLQELNKYINREPAADAP